LNLIPNGEECNGKRLGWCGVSFTGTSFGRLQAKHTVLLKASTEGLEREYSCFDGSARAFFSHESNLASFNTNYRTANHHYTSLCFTICQIKPIKQTGQQTGGCSPYLAISVGGDDYPENLRSVPFSQCSCCFSEASYYFWITFQLDLGQLFNQTLRNHVTLLST
jgi:hypothetical protein